MLRYLFLLSLIFSLNAYSDVFLSSPKIKLNAQNQRVIEFRIENERINDGDITLNEYKTNNPIDESFIEYTLINDFGNYHTFTIVLDDKYKEDYFSFKILIKEEFAKDIFIYLPSKIRNTFSLKSYEPKRILSETKEENIVLSEPEKIEPEIKEETIDENIVLSEPEIKETIDENIVLRTEKKETIDENIVLSEPEMVEPEISKNDIFKATTLQRFGVWLKK